MARLTAFILLCGHLFASCTFLPAVEGDVIQKRNSASANIDVFGDLAVDQELSIQHSRVARSTSPEDIRIRLANGSTPYEGRVEVLYNGVWGGVCSFSRLPQKILLKARVVCRQLGYYGEVEVLDQRYFGETPGPLLMHLQNCYGDESSIAECVHTGWGDSRRCTKSMDMAIRCGDDAIHNLRLADGPSPSEGRLEILYNNTWGTVCNTNATIDLATIVCRQLGYPTTVGLALSGTFPPGTGTIWLEPVCDARNHSIADCIHDGWENHECDHSQDVGVVCADFLPVRLADGRRSSEGRIEVMHDGEWGGVCNWWREPALGDVVCRQLGYPRAEKNVDEAFFGRGEGPMWLRPRCVGNETSLLHCPHWGWGKGCDKSNAAGVICVDDSIRHQAAQAFACAKTNTAMITLVILVVLFTGVYVATVVLCTVIMSGRIKRRRKEMDSGVMFSSSISTGVSDGEKKSAFQEYASAPPVTKSEEPSVTMMQSSAVNDSDVVQLIGEDDED